MAQVNEEDSHLRAVNVGLLRHVEGQLVGLTHDFEAAIPPCRWAHSDPEGRRFVELCSCAPCVTRKRFRGLLKDVEALRDDLGAARG